MADKEDRGSKDSQLDLDDLDNNLNKTIENIKESPELQREDRRATVENINDLSDLTDERIHKDTIENVSKVKGLGPFTKERAFSEIPTLKDLSDVSKDEEKQTQDLKATIHDSFDPAEFLNDPFDSIPSIDEANDSSLSPNSFEDLSEDEDGSELRDSNKATLYAGFWLRLFAFIIDLTFITILSSFAIKFVHPKLFNSLHPNLIKTLEGILLNLSESQIYIKPVLKYLISYSLLISCIGFVSLITVGFAYFCVMESSKFKGTIGKLLVGIKVESVNRRSLTLLSAFSRYVVKIVCILPFGLGLITIPFSTKKQALHDFFIKSVVKKRSYYSFNRGIFGFLLAILCILLYPLINGKVQFSSPVIEKKDIAVLEKEVFQKVEDHLSNSKKEIPVEVENVPQIPEKSIVIPSKSVNDTKSYVSIDEISKADLPVEKTKKNDPLKIIKQKAKEPKAPFYDTVSGSLSIAGKRFSARSVVLKSSSDEGTLKVYIYDRVVSRKEKNSIQVPLGSILNVNFLLKKPLPNCLNSNVRSHIGRMLVKGMGITQDFRGGSGTSSYSLKCDKEGRVSGKISDKIIVNKRGTKFSAEYSFNINSLVRR